MHCIILANQDGTLPPALLPMKGRAVIDYLIDDVLNQKDVTSISVITNHQSFRLVNKHLRNAYPSSLIVKAIETNTVSSVLANSDDVLILQGNTYTSLKLQDFIRYHKQFKTITKASFDKLDPKEIPFYIIPQRYSKQIDSLPSDAETHTYNCGSGYNIIVI